MSRRIILSKRASKRLDKLLKYLETEWSLNVKNDFIKKFDKSIRQIQIYPNSCPKSDYIRSLHKCVLTKQTTIFYRIDKESITIVTLFDNRQDPNKLK